MGEEREGEGVGGRKGGREKRRVSFAEVEKMLTYQMRCSRRDDFN